MQSRKRTGVGCFMTVATLLAMSSLVVLSNGCQTFKSVGQEIRATLEPPIAEADDLVGMVNERAQRIDDIAARLAVGEPVTQDEKAELVGLTNSAATAARIAKESTERALFIVRLLPKPEAKK